MKVLKRILSVLLIFSIFMTMIITTAVSSSALDTSDDYRAWSHKDSRWSSTTMGNSTLGNGGAPTTAITKLAIQAGLRDAHDFNIGDMATLLTANSGYSGSSIIWNAPTQASLNLFTSKGVFYDDSTGIAPADKYSAIRTKVGEGWHLVVKVKTSTGSVNYVAVDEKLTLADASKVYIMDCQSNTNNNVNVVLGKRYSLVTQIIGYKGKAEQNSQITSDYRRWEINNSNWASTVLNGSNTISNSLVGGGDLLLASTKLAIQAGVRTKDTEGGVNAVNSAKADLNSFTSGGIISSLDSVRSELFGENSTADLTVVGTEANTTAKFSTTDSTYVNAIKNKLNDGYFVAVRVNNSAGWVAVDTDKTLETGDIYIMRSTPDYTKNADIRLADYYDTMNFAAGFRPEGVQVSFSGKATFSASYTKNGSTQSFSSGSYVPNEAVVTISATPKVGYTADNNWTISGGYSFTTSSAGLCTFTANTSTSTTADITYTPTADVNDINYSYSTNSGSFNYTTIPASASTGATVEMTISPKTDGSFVYELDVDVRDAGNNQIPVKQIGTTYSFEMPGSDVTVTFTGKNVDDWRKWARDDERWKNKEMVTGHTVNTDGAVMISLAKMVIQAGLQTPTTLTADGYDVNEVVDALKSYINSDGGMLFNTYGSQIATALGFDSYLGRTTNGTNSDAYDIYNSASAQTNRNNIVAYLKQGYHQVIRLYKSNGTDSEWFIIDEEKTLAKSGNKANVDLDDVYIFRPTADASVNSNYTLAQLCNNGSGYRYIYKNHSFLGGTTPSRQVSITLKTNGAVNNDAHKGSVAATYTIDGETMSFSSGDYVPSRATVKIKYNADPGYYAFDNWTTSSDSDMTVFAAAQTANPKEFTVTASEFRATTATITNSTTAKIDCNITPEEYHIYYTDGTHFSYSNCDSDAGYNTEASFKINPDNGYTVTAGDISFTDAGDEAIAGVSASNPSGRTFTFTMPAQDVYISVTATAQTYDDYRTWGIGDSRWGTSYLRKTLAGTEINTNTSEGGTLFMAFTKLLIQCGKVNYDPYTQSTNTSTVTGLASSVANSTATGKEGTYYMYNTSGGILDPAMWGVLGVNLGIIPSFVDNTANALSSSNTSNWDYGVSGGATANNSSRTQAYVYRRLLGSSGSSFSVNTYAPLIRDYLRGDNSEAGTSVSKIITTYSNDVYNNSNYKFHIMLNVDGYGWVVVDEAQTLNDTAGNGIWIWTSRRGNSKDTNASNIIKLTSGNFTQIAAFKFPTSGNANYFGSSKTSYTAKLGDSNTNNATLNASYNYLGANYGTFTTDFYVPHGAAVTVSADLADHYQPATGKIYGAWELSDGYTSHSSTELVYDTVEQSGANARKEYSSEYYITSVPRVHVKYLGDANGTINGADSTPSAATDIYLGDTETLTLTPASNYEVDTIKIIKTDSSYNSLGAQYENGLNPDETSVTFDSDLTGGAESYFIVQATFKSIGHGLRITYNFKEYDPSKSGTHEYIEPASGEAADAYLTNKTYVKNLDSYDYTAENAIAAAVAANAPVLHNVYFDYTLDFSSITSDTTESLHTASVTMTPSPKTYTVSVNASLIQKSYHYQEEIALDATDFGVNSNSVVWTRGAESGKAGSANVCYDKIYLFRVTSDLNLTVGENLGSRNTVNGTSAVTPGYTEVKRVNNVEKCIQNFYVQDYFDENNPTIYDSNGDVIEGASNITFLGAGVLFYAYNTDTNKPVKAGFNNIEPGRESVYSTLSSNKNAFLTESTAQGSNFKGSYLNYSYIKASTDNGNILRYSTANSSYNYFFSASITNDRSEDSQKYVYRVYSFYACSYTLNGETKVAVVLSDNYAQANLYSSDYSPEDALNRDNNAIEANSFSGANAPGDAMSSVTGS